MDRDANAALHIENYIANDNVNPWRQAEDWYFMYQHVEGWRNGTTNEYAFHLFSGSLITGDGH